MSREPSAQDPLQIAAGRKASGDALDEGNRFFSTLARISPVGIFRTDAQGNCVYVNERWCKITGMKYDEALGAGWAQAVHPDDREKVAQARYISAQARQHFIMEYRVQRPNGVTRWVQGEAAAEMDAADEVIGYVGTITDITQSKQAEDELQRFFNIIPDLVCIASINGRFLKINPMWREMLGYTEQEILAKPFLEFIHPDDRDATMKEVEQQLAGESTMQFTNRYRCKDGSYRWLEWKATPAVDKKLLFASARDVTERNKIEAARHEALDRFQKITQLVPGIVYQFRLRPDGSTSIPYASEAARAIYRLDPEEVREDASKIFTPVHPDDLGSFMASIHASARDLTPWQHEYRLKFGDGAVRWLFGNSIPQREADGSTLWHGFITDITERKESEERLRQSDRKLRAFLDNISDIIWLIDANLNMAYVSPSVTRLLGVLPGELVGHPSALVIHPDDMGVIDNAMRHVMEHPGEPHTIQYRVSHKDGRWIHVESTGVNMLDNPAINGVLVTMRDITERKQAEQALAESESRFREIFNTVSDAIFIHDAETGRIIDVNRRMLEMYGLTREQVLVCGPDDLSAGTPPYSSTEVAEKIRLARTEGPQTFDWLARARDGHLFWVEVSLRFAHIGNQQRILAVVRDISDRKQVENALRESESRYRLLVESSPFCIHEIDLEGHLLSMNRTGLDMLGLDDAGKIRGTPYLDTVNQRDAGRVGALLREAIADGITSHFEFAATGDVLRYFKSCFIPIIDSGGKVLKLMGITEDITERKQAEERIRNLAFYDTLTQLPNRRLLNDRLGQIMAASKRSSHYGALMFLDLDNFKPLNDMHGHSVGDLLLVEVAHRLTSCVREVDTVARFGGDEFVVMLSELDEDKAESTAQTSIVAEKICTALAEPYLLTLKQENNAEKIIEHHCTASVGVVLFINHEASAEDILKWADTAMYQAKADGRNLVRFHK